jgi:hypothetical protein
MTRNDAMRKRNTRKTWKTKNITFSGFLYKANSIKVVSKQREKVEYEREMLAGSGD